MSSRYVGPKLPGKAGIAQRAIDFVIKKIPKKKKVSPTITSVQPSKTVREEGIKASIKKAKGDEYTKRIRLKDAAEKKLKTGKKMMKEGQEERKKLVDTKKAFQFKNIKSYHAVQPGNPNKIKLENIKKPTPGKKYKRGKDLAKGGRVGLKAGTNLFKKKSNVQKIKETFGSKKRVNAKGGKLIGGQKNIDVAAPFGKITGKDFAKLRSKKTKKKVI